LLIGTATPAASAAVIGTMAVTGRAVHLKNGYFIVNEGYEYVLALAGAAAATAALGPGPVSVDSLLNADRLSGVAAAAVQLAVFWRPPSPADHVAEAGSTAATPDKDS
jgi:putative oxidoreductase